MNKGLFEASFEEGTPYSISLLLPFPPFAIIVIYYVSISIL